MPIAVIKKATPVADLLKDFFGRLSAKERQRATADFLRANPHIGRRVQLGAGTAVVVPASGVDPAAGRGTDRWELAGAVSLVGVTQRELEQFGKHLKASLVAAREELQGAAALLKSRELAEALRHRELAGVGEAARSAAKARLEDLERTRGFLDDVLPRVQKDLAELGRRLGWT